MRIGKRGFSARIKGNLHIEFGDEKLTSFAGLELLRRFCRKLDLAGLLRKAERKLALGGDLRLSSLVMLIVGMLLVGARRLRQIRHLGTDALLLRFAGLSRAPSERTLSRSLKKLGYKSWPELDRLSTATVRSGLLPFQFVRLTLDIDGSVLTTGLQVKGALRGFNPHHRKNPSYYPILATLAQTGHVVAHKNRRGNVHDSHQSAPFLRRSVRSLRNDLQFDGLLEVRADSAFFQRDFLRMCDRLNLEYALKVPMAPWLNLRGVVKQHDEQEWQWVDRKRSVQGLFVEVPIGAWNRTERVAIYRKRVGHRPVKGRQLELFNPDDGYWEYSAVATNKTLQLRALYDFMNGHGIQEKVNAELKSGLAYDAIPTNSYRANTAWQKLNILAHNLLTSFQVITTAPHRAATLRRTTSFILQSARTIRVEWLNKAGRLLRPGGRPVLRLARNEAVEELYSTIEESLAA